MTAGEPRFQKLSVRDEDAESLRGIELRPLERDTYAVRTPSGEARVEWSVRPDGRVQATIDGRAITARVERMDHGRWRVEWGGVARVLIVEDELAARTSRVTGGRSARARGPITLPAPMPGTVIQVMVEIGQSVAAGQPLLVIEAMKMQNEIVSPVAGTLQSMHVRAGQAVDARQTLCVVTP